MTYAIFMKAKNIVLQVGHHRCANHVGTAQDVTMLRGRIENVYPESGSEGELKLMKVLDNE